MRDLLLLLLSVPAMLIGGNQKISTPEPVTIILGGDVMLGRSVMTASLRGNDPTYPFAKIKDVLSSADISFVNLENPIVENCPWRDSGMIFCASPQMIDGLLYAGVDIINLANNHTQNYGKAGYVETKSHLSDAVIGYTGDGSLSIVEKRDTRFGFLGFEKSQQVNPILTEDEKKLIAESDQKVDVLIVAMHWGVEYQSTALPGVQKLAHELVDLGADVVVGHHPHWVQNIEEYNGKKIYYSLGNLVFDQMWSEETKKGLLVRLTFVNGEVTYEERLPIYMAKLGQPRLN